MLKSKRSLFISTGTLALGLGWLVFVFLNAPYGPCGWGFGPHHQEARVSLVRSQMREALPSTLKLSSFKCSGFQDLLVEARFDLSADDAQRLLKGLNETLATDQNFPLFLDSEKTKSVRVEGGMHVTEYRLPGTEFLYVHDIKVIRPAPSGLPLDDAPAVIEFSGFQF